MIPCEISWGFSMSISLEAAERSWRSLEGSVRRWISRCFALTWTQRLLIPMVRRRASAMQSCHDVLRFSSMANGGGYGLSLERQRRVLEKNGSSAMSIARSRRPLQGEGQKCPHDAVRMAVEAGESIEQTTTLEPCTGLRGESGFGRNQAREHAAKLASIRCPFPTASPKGRCSGAKALEQLSPGIVGPKSQHGFKSAISQARFTDFSQSHIAIGMR